jgi:hypothetical protein
MITRIVLMEPATATFIAFLGLSAFMIMIVLVLGGYHRHRQQAIVTRQRDGRNDGQAEVLIFPVRRRPPGGRGRHRR